MEEDNAIEVMTEQIGGIDGDCTLPKIWMRQQTDLSPRA
jgi:hypothetical protein